MLGNGTDPVEVTVEACEAEVVADAVEPEAGLLEVLLPEVAVPEVALAAAEPDPEDVPHPVRTRPAAAAVTANAPAVRRTLRA